LQNNSHFSSSRQSAITIATALRGRRDGIGWMARCPAHEDRTPSLSIRDSDEGKVLVHCFAGCEQERVIAALRSRGIWGETGQSSGFRHSAPRPGRDDSKRTEEALAIWHSAAPAKGTPVEVYLASRGLRLPPPPTLRFHSGLRHRQGGLWPAMIALVTRGQDDVPVAIHRTFLAADGRGKAPVGEPKKMWGPCSTGGVRLGTATDDIMIGEGIETCLSAMQLKGYPAWAALSTSGLRSLDLPHSVRDVIVLADGDEPGEAAALSALHRWRREGRRVRLESCPSGTDFNDFLMRRTCNVQGRTP
jgi:putative DNA primase/helicase